MSWRRKVLKLAVCLGMSCSSVGADRFTQSLEEARIKLAEKEPREAIRLLERCVRLRGKNAEISELLAQACVADEDLELAAFYFEEAASTDELKYYCYLRAAELYQQLSEPTQALQCYEEYLKIWPNDRTAALGYANLKSQAGDRQRALEIFVAHADHDVDVCLKVADLFQSFGNLTQARIGYNAVLEINPNHREALHQLWHLYVQSKNYAALVPVAQRLRDLGESEYQGVPLDLFLSVSKGYEQAFDALLGPDMAFLSGPIRITLPSWVWRPIAITTMPSKLLSKKERLKGLEEKVVDAKSKGDYEEAIANLWQILGMNGKNVDAWIELTECLEHINKYDIAEMTIQEAMKSQPSVELYRAYLGIILRTHGSAEYVRILRDIKHKFPKDADLRLMWAKAREMYLGDATGARRSYEKFLKLAPPDHPETDLVRRRLATYQHL
ncbi:MAG: tetratricopeptide repeat protein [Verrucomicrobiota bacterium]|nr:MAG: tetratricopeptide repeat protein [Verrucomicrobiota bacterium]